MRAAGLVPIIVVILTPCAWSAWEIEYSDTLVQEMARAGSPISKRVGRFATRQECLDAIDQAVAQSGDPTLRLHMYPAPGGYDETDTSSSGGSEGTQEPVWGQDGYGIPFYNIIRNAQQKAAERRAQKGYEFYGKGCEEYTRGNWEAAIQWYQEALKMVPGDPLFQQHLKNAEAQRGMRSLNDKGIQEFQNGNWEAAVKYFQAALEVTPNDPVLQQNLTEAQWRFDHEREDRVLRERAAREREVEKAVREKREVEQKRRLTQTDAAFADLQADAAGFLGKPTGAANAAIGTDGGPVPGSVTGRILGQFHVPVPPSFPVSDAPVIEGDSSPVVELPSQAYRIIGLIGKNIKEAPAKFGEAVVSALGYGSQLNLLKVTKGLSDEAGRSIQGAVDVIGRGYPEAQTTDLIKGSETRAMRIYVDSFSNVPLPPSEDEQQEMEVNGRKWFKWAAKPLEGPR